MSAADKFTIEERARALILENSELEREELIWMLIVKEKQLREVMQKLNAGNPIGRHVLNVGEESTYPDAPQSSMPRKIAVGREVANTPLDRKDR